MIKIVINKCFGGFGLSEEAIAKYNTAKGTSGISIYDIERDDPELIAVVEELGQTAGGRYAELIIIEIPDGVEYTIEDYDGIESIHEVHRSWG